jgi:uncharacterized protein YeaO (DUF488 family)
MSGRVDETNHAELKERHLSPQSEIADFCQEDNTTYVAVVSLPRDNISDIVDEVWPELGMPEWALKRFLKRRSGYRSNSAVDCPHEKAYRDTDLHGIYQSHLHSSSEAKRRLNEAVEKVASGENITLVCYEEDGQSCHRHLLVDIIRERVERRENSRFKLSA